MAYIGKTPIVGNFQKCDAITTSATDTFNLLVNTVAVSPESANHCIVSLNGVIQEPGIGAGFTISGSTIVFNSALTTSDTIDFILLLGSTLDIGVPSDDTCGAAQIKDDLISGTTALASEPDDTDEFLVSDAGTLKRIDYSLIKASNTPAFFAYLSSNQTNMANTSHTVVTFNAEEFDIGSGFNTGTYDYTIPETGKYFIGFQVRKSNYSSTRSLARLTNNGSSIREFESGSHSAYSAVVGQTIRSFSASDVLKVDFYHSSGSTETIRGSANDTNFFGYKIIE